MVIAQTLINPGDEVLIPDLGFVLYQRHVMLAGGVPVPYHLTQENRFVPDMEELGSLLTPRTKAIIVNYPGNPTGAVMSRREAEALAEFADHHGLLIISDEVYDEIVYNGEHNSMLGTSENVIYVNSFSKTYALTGWRIGYLAAPVGVIPELTKVQYYNIACPPTPMQYAVLEALKGPQEIVAERREELRKRMDLITHLLRAGVICSPGSAFGPGGEGHLRFSFANRQENITKAMEIVKDVSAHMGP